MKIGRTKLRLSSGKIIKFKSARKRANWERVAQAYKHGWRPKRRRRARRKRRL